MDLSNILAYQKADIALRKLQRKIETSEHGKQLLLHKREFNGAKKQLTDAEATAEEIVAKYNEAVAAFEDSSARADKTAKALETCDQDEAKESELLAVLESLSARLGDLSRRIHDLKKRSESALAAYTEAQKRGKHHKEAYLAAKEAYDTHAGQFADEFKKLEAERVALRKKTDAKAIAEYDALAAEKLLPAFVPAAEVDKSYVCGGCGMQVAAAAKADLDAAGRCRCESCRRIIYKP